MFVKIDGKCHYLRRAGDHEREVLEGITTKGRDKKAALKFLGKKGLKRHDRADVFVVDCLQPYGATLAEWRRCCAA